MAVVALHPNSTYTPEAAEKIFNLLEAGWSLNKICKVEGGRNGVPKDPATVRAWVRAIPSFAERYALARKNQLEYLADEMLDIAEDTSKDVHPDGKSNTAAVQRDRLRVDVIKFQLVHLMPEKYGNLIKQEVTGKDGEPLQAVDLESLARRIAFETSKPKTD